MENNGMSYPAKVVMICIVVVCGSAWLMEVWPRVTVSVRRMQRAAYYKVVRTVNAAVRPLIGGAQ
jgi:hypothetical protein